MNWTDFREAFAEAERTMGQADDVAASMARMLVGRLRNCRGDTLEKLKRELRGFNMQTHTWKEQK